MVETPIGELLLALALLFALTYLLAGLLERARIPGILAALFVALLVRRWGEQMGMTTGQ